MAPVDLMSSTQRCQILLACFLLMTVLHHCRLKRPGILIKQLRQHCIAAAVCVRACVCVCVHAHAVSS